MSETEIELRRIVEMGRADIVGRWPEYFDSPPPHKASLEFLRMALAWRVQARKNPAVVRRLQRKLEQMAKTMANGRTPRALSAGPRINSGTTFMRTWRGKDYAVTVVENGFVFEGTRYASLSEIARKITGTRWNGPSFFGLRKQKAKQASKGQANG
jgi:hypothetical protein